VSALSEICIKCKKASTCTTICSKLENQIPKEINDDYYAIGIDTGGVGDLPEPLKDDPKYDKYKNKALGDHFAPMITEYPFESIKKDFFIWIFRNDEKELKRQFIDFLKCNSMSKIAELSGCTKQNIFKMFQRKIRQLAMLLRKRKGLLSLGKVRSPAKFKQLFALG